MDESWNTSLLTGDQCAICENPLDGDATEIEEQEGILRVCRACALERATTKLSQADPGVVLAEAQARSKTVHDLLSCRADEQTRLEEVGQFIENLARAVTHWQGRASELEQQTRGLEAELRRLQERMQRTEALLVPAAPAVPETPPPPTEATESPAESELTAESVGPPVAGESVRPHFPMHAPALNVEQQGFTVEELRLAQRCFSESPFTEKTRSVRRSLGKPVVNLSRVVGTRPQILATIAWEIVWYQFLINLEPETEPEERVSLFGEGMELEELSPSFQQANAGLDDEGRIDASELEFSLLEDRSEIIHDDTAEQAALEDATEEVWDRHSAPEFRWDD